MTISNLIKIFGIVLLFSTLVRLQTQFFVPFVFEHINPSPPEYMDFMSAKMFMIFGEQKCPMILNFGNEIYCETFSPVFCLIVWVCFVCLFVSRHWQMTL